MLFPIRIRRVVPRPVASCKRILWLVIIANVVILSLMVFNKAEQFLEGLRGKRSPTAGYELMLVEVPGCDCKRHQYSWPISESSVGPPASKVRCPTSTSQIRGRRQRVISYSVFNKWEPYLHRVPRLAKSADDLYPSSAGWAIRIYHNFQSSSDRGFKEAMCNVSCSHGNVDFCDMRLLLNEEPASAYYNQSVPPTVWRFMPMGEEAVEVTLVRDLDSDLTAREASAVEDWLKTGLPLHIMRDNPYHGTPILAGMWGTRRSPQFDPIVDWPRVEKSLLSDCKQLFGQQSDPSTFNKYADQQVLSSSVHPAICKLDVQGTHKLDGQQGEPLKLCYVHDSYLCQIYKDSVPWPTRRLENVTNNFVGANGHPPMLSECPTECRPKVHRDWVYC